MTDVTNDLSSAPEISDSSTFLLDEAHSIAALSSPTSSLLLKCLICHKKLTRRQESLDIPDEREPIIDGNFVNVQATSDVELFDHQLLEDLFFEDGRTLTSEQYRNLVEVVSKANSPLDAPMCQKCVTSLTNELNRQLKEAENECVQYKHALDQLMIRCPDSTGFDQEDARRKLNLLQIEERELQEELATLEREEQELTRVLEGKIRDRERMEERDDELYKQLRDNHRTLLEQVEEQQSLRMQIRHAEGQLKRLQSVSILELVFPIDVHSDSPYGTINGLRLGRLTPTISNSNAVLKKKTTPSSAGMASTSLLSSGCQPLPNCQQNQPQKPVEWNEVNAALGQVAFLIKVLADRLHYQFHTYCPVPRASHSIVRVLSPHRPSSTITTAPTNNASAALVNTVKTTTVAVHGDEFPLYGSGGWRPFGHQPSLDQGVIGLVECFCQIAVEIHRIRSNACNSSGCVSDQSCFEGPPHPIVNRDKIMENNNKTACTSNTAGPGSTAAGPSTPAPTYYSLRMQLNSEERWTRAMHLFLADLKWACQAAELVSSILP